MSPIAAAFQGARRSLSVLVLVTSIRTLRKTPQCVSTHLVEVVYASASSEVYDEFLWLKGRVGFVENKLKKACKFGSWIAQ
jgi:hypothetical protein